jgi:hypothetical protein
MNSAFRTVPAEERGPQNELEEADTRAVGSGFLLCSSLESLALILATLSLR